MSATAPVDDVRADPDPRGPLRLLTIVVALTLVAAVSTIALLVMSTRASVVQGVEVDAAGRQRRLSERIAYDVALLALDPGREDVRAELASTADALRDVRVGLLEGDAALGLDGEVPAAFRGLYAPAGLDLTARLDRFERAASAIAETPGPGPAAAEAAIVDEAAAERLVLDLDRVVETLAATEDEESDARSARALVGLAASVALGLVALGVLESVRRRLGRQLARRAELVGELATSEDVYRTTVDSLHDAVVVQDDRGSVVRANAAAHRLLARYAVDGTIRVGDHLADIVPTLRDEDGRALRPEDRPSRRALRGEGPDVGLVVQLGTDDDRRWFRANASTVDRADGTARLVVLTFADVTDERFASERAALEQRVELEREQEMVAKLIALDDARNNFVSTVSHELRTPLTSLVGYLEMLDDGTAGPLDEVQRSMVGAGLRNTHRLRRLIDDLLEISIVERDASVDRTGEVVVAHLVDRVVEALAPLADGAGVGLVTAPVVGTLAVSGDLAELERVLVNLVGNAVKFTPAGGSIAIDAHLVVGDPAHVAISVTDTGVGIPDDERDHVFTRFFRSRGATRDQVQGSGLGLAIVAKLVEAHAGTIHLSSEVGVGTSVTIELPVRVRSAVVAGG